MRKIALVIIVMLLADCELVTAQLSVMATVSGADTICAGTIDTLEASVTGGTGPYAYHWSPSTGVSDSTTQYPTIQPSATTTYCVTVTDAGGDTAFACITVQVDLIQVSGFNQSGSGPLYSITVYETGGIPLISYLWSTGSTQDTTLAPGGIVSVTLTDNLGCSATAADTVVIAPLAVTAISTGPDTICNGYTDTLEAQVTGGIGPYTYYWSPSTGISSDTVQNPTVEPTATTTYCVTVTDSTGATASSCTTIIVDQLHIDSFTQTGSSPPYQITVWVSGGYTPYTFLWSNGSSATLTYVSSGVVSVTVSDGHCSVVGSDTVHVVTLSVTASSSGPDTLCSGNIDTLKALLTGGTGAYTYHWSPLTGGISSDTVQNPTVEPTVTTTYCVTVTDSNGDSASSCTTIIVDQLHIDSFTQTGVLPPYQITVWVSGGITPYSYIWNNGSSATLTYASGGVVSVTVSDGICSVVGSDTIRTGAITFQHDSTIINTPWYYCLTADSTDTAGLRVIQQPAYGTTSKIYIGNQVCLVYTPNNNHLGFDTFGIQYCTGTSCDTIIIVMNVYSLCYECVWPGDANEDGIVNNSDLLPIGLAYGSTGPLRPNATINWVGQPAPYWQDSLADSTNYKFIDCNGNGVIDGNDTVAILLNYSQTHTRGGSYNGVVSGEPILTPVASKDTVINGDTLIVQFVLADSAVSVNNVYALAFTLNYDPIIIDSNQTTVAFGNSWLGTDIDKISIAKNFKSTGQLECGVTRIDHVTRSGSGPIGAAMFVITTDNINGIISHYNYYVARFYIGDITMIDSAGNILTVGGGNDSVLITLLPTGIGKDIYANSHVHIYPNPANNQLVISAEQWAIEQIKISDVLGNGVISNVYSPPGMLTKQQLDISNLVPGIYTVEVLTGKGVAVQKLVIAR